MGTFHEVLPGNSVFSNFYYIRTKEIEYLNHTIKFRIKSYISMEILNIGIETLYKTSREQAVAGLGASRKYSGFIAFLSVCLPVD